MNRILYKQIEQNKRNTWIILGLYTVLILIISIFLGMLFTVYIGGAFFIIGLVYIAHVYFDATRHLMKVTNAVEITKETEPQIYELVEELCLAGGLPVPKLYITPDQAPNAFATGRDPQHASFQGEAIVAEIIITNLTYIICRKNRENSMLTPKMTPHLENKIRSIRIKILIFRDFVLRKTA